MVHSTMPLSLDEPCPLEELQAAEEEENQNPVGIGRRVVSVEFTMPR